jgi:hypothetical protein
MQPGESLFFTVKGKDKTDKELCFQMKDSEKTGHDFVEHIRIDHHQSNVQFIAAAFVGDRALGEGLKDYPDKNGKNLKIEAPPGTQEELTEKARKWVEILGEGYEASKECGCVVQLDGKFKYTNSSFADTITVTGELVWQSVDAENDAQSGGGQPVVLRPTSGNITVQVEFKNALGVGAHCAGNGRKTFDFDQIRRGALRHMSLKIAEDGQYEVNLVIPDQPDPFPAWEFQGTCTYPNITANQTVPVRQVAVALGKQRGMVDDEKGIVGQLAAPISRGPRTINGSWSFSAGESK